MTERSASSQPWPAPPAPGAVDATVTVPGSKSVTNRALILAALAGEPGWVRRPLRSRDTLLMAEALRALGVGIEETVGSSSVLPGAPHVQGEAWRIIPAAPRGPAAVDVGNAGTVMRFLPPVAALADGPVRFDGDPRAHERPLHGVIDALRHLGARIDDAGRGALPLTVRGNGTVPGGPVSVDASSSSQFVSALLLSAPRFQQGVEVRHTGSVLPSVPHIRMTVDMLRRAGAQVDSPESGGAPGVWRVTPGALLGRDLVIEPDLSNAQPFLAAALVTGGTVTIPDWPTRTTQPGDALRDILTRMGGRCVLDERGLTLTGTGRVHGIDLDLEEAGELAPGIAAIAALAESESVLRGIAHLRLHETDRLAALTREINALGGDVTETSDGLRIRPRTLHGGVFRTYEDHRMATAGAILGLQVKDLEIENVETTGKTLPDFPALWHAMLAGGRTDEATAASQPEPARHATSRHATSRVDTPGADTPRVDTPRSTTSPAEG